MQIKDLGLAVTTVLFKLLIARGAKSQHISVTEYPSSSPVCFNMKTQKKALPTQVKCSFDQCLMRLGWVLFSMGTKFEKVLTDAPPISWRKKKKKDASDVISFWKLGEGGYNVLLAEAYWGGDRTMEGALSCLFLHGTWYVYTTQGLWTGFFFVILLDSARDTKWTRVQRRQHSATPGEYCVKTTTTTTTNIWCCCCLPMWTWFST